MTVLRYGTNSSVHLEFAEDVAPGEFGTPRGQALTDLGVATEAALVTPIDYPPLAQTFTPADHVVLAVDRAVPQVAQVTAALVHALVEAGVAADGIAVLRAPADVAAGADDPCRLVQRALREQITVLTHDPDDRRQLAYLAASESGEAILINRRLHEADVVLPVGCVRDEDAAGYFGIHSAIFPAFSDAKTLQRFRGFGSINGQPARRRELAAEVDHVAWLLGINCTVQVVPAAGGGAQHVLIGESEAVRQRSRALYREAWHCSVADRASLVVAAIEGDTAQQTWENVGQALQTAENFVDEDGAIAICCELATAPGPALRRMVGASSRQSALRHVAKDRPVDALPAAQVAHALDQHTVYLLSRLEPSLVEGLDIVPIATEDELGRLVRQHPSCILLSNAPYITVSN
jgi:lactate racemase